MHKRLFSVASFTAVVGAFAAAGACSSTTTIVVSGEGGSDASHKSSTNPPPGSNPPGTTPGKTPPPPPADDGGGDDGPGPGGTCPDTTPITSADIDAQIGWKPPAAIQDVCTKANIASLKAAFDNAANKTYDDIITDITGSIGAGSCLNCIVTQKTASNWGPLVQDPMGALPNFGACYGGFPGSNAACGKANEYLEICVLTACQDCADQNSFDACTSSKGITTACADPISTLQTACASVTGISDNTSPINTACGDIIDGASTLCHGGIYDGG